jgi:hypothetical protein
MSNDFAVFQACRCPSQKAEAQFRMGISLQPLVQLIKKNVAFHTRQGRIPISAPRK